jgi:hypothetical protein
MSELLIPPASPAPAPMIAPLSHDSIEMRRLIREELDRNNRYLTFAQEQINKDRAFYKHLFTWAGSLISVLVIVAGVFHYNSVTQMRADMKAAVDAAIAEAKSTVNAELANVRTEVQKRVDTEFKSENIVALVRDVAKGKTEKELENIIRSETSAQVKKGIEAQTAVIRKTVEDQTRKAVDALQPSIGTAVMKATEDQVKKAVVPIEKQMGGYDQMIRIGNLATLARNDDRRAFDYLIQVASGKMPESSNAEIRRLADSTAAAVITEKVSGLQLSMQFKEKQTAEAMKKFMLSTNRNEREAALDNYPAEDTSILPLLIQIIEKDDSISVTHRAVQRFNSLTKQSFKFWDRKPILAWWEKNRSSYK